MDYPNRIVDQQRYFVSSRETFQVFGNFGVILLSKDAGISRVEATQKESGCNGGLGESINKFHEVITVSAGSGQLARKKYFGILPGNKICSGYPLGNVALWSKNRNPQIDTSGA